MRIALGADHAGYEYKDRIACLLRDRGHDALDFGTHDATPVDYRQYGFAVGEAVATGQADPGGTPTLSARVRSRIWNVVK